MMRVSRALWFGVCASVLASPTAWALSALAPRTHLGDLLGESLETDMRLLSTEALTPMQRVALTANGNFQRILSAYYDRAVEVEILRNERKAPGLYEREVNLKIGPKTCCSASSEVRCLSADATALVDSGRVGIGQLFEHLGELPKFSLERVEKGQGHLSRHYTLASRSVLCSIEERMPLTLFDLDFLDDDDDVSDPR